MLYVQVTCQAIFTGFNPSRLPAGELDVVEFVGEEFGLGLVTAVRIHHSARHVPPVGLARGSVRECHLCMCAPVQQRQGLR